MPVVIEVNYKATDPKARENPWKGKREFLASLAKLEDAGNKVTLITRTKGLSRCKCGCKGEKASIGWGKIFQHTTPEGVILKWHDHLIHYVKVHNVKPPAEFIDKVLATTFMKRDLASNEIEALEILDAAIASRAGSRYPILIPLAQAKALRNILRR